MNTFIYELKSKKSNIFKNNCNYEDTKIVMKTIKFNERSKYGFI